MTTAPKSKSARTKPRRRQSRGALMIVIALLVGSGVIRLGGSAGSAFARVAETTLDKTDVTAEERCQKDGATMALFEALKEREARVSEREVTLESRMRALSISESQIDEKLAMLVSAEERLSQTIAIADSASDEDVARLVTLYENMKPKDASPLFAEMAPEFAAGFLVRMRPDAAAAVLSGLEPTTAYAISVLMAGRNANAPKN